MIKVDVITKATEIEQITVYNHAGYADEGQDLVCAGVSSIVVGMMNALVILVPETCDFEMKKGYTNIKVLHQSQDVQVLLQAMLVQLKTMEETYKSYIRTYEQEV